MHSIGLVYFGTIEESLAYVCLSSSPVGGYTFSGVILSGSLPYLMGSGWYGKCWGRFGLMWLCLMRFLLAFGGIQISTLFL